MTLSTNAGEFATALKETTKALVGLKSPQEMLEAGFIAFAIGAFASVATGIGIVLLFLSLIPLGIGILRMLPYGNRLWPLGGGR